MAHKLIFNASIPDDLAAAISYYEDISPALANRFRTAVDRRLDEIAKRPESFSGRCHADSICQNRSIPVSDLLRPEVRFGICHRDLARFNGTGDVAKPDLNDSKPRYLGPVRLMRAVAGR